MGPRNRWGARWGMAGLLPAMCLVTVLGMAAQRGGRGAGSLPENPIAVPVPQITGPVRGPGTPYESVQSLPLGHDLSRYGYGALEYFVSGSAAGEPYKTRIVIRKPMDDAAFSGLVLVEAMHPSGSAHLFEYSSVYSTDRGHIAVEVVTTGLEHLKNHNPARYADLDISTAQTTEVLAQVGAFLKENPSSPLAGLGVRKMVLAGTSATARIVVQYLPAHAVYRTASMGEVYDGYLVHGNGETIDPVDAPLIQVPTMRELGTAGRGGLSAPSRQDSDEPGNQYRLYEFAGMGHLDSRDSVRTQPNPCVRPTSLFPMQAYIAVALDHLFRWVDQSVVPPRADRVLLDRDLTNDGSLMALDAHGNPMAGIRNPYVDLPVAQYATPNEAADTLPTSPSVYITAEGQAGAELICNLGAYQIVFSRQELGELYGSKAEYVRRVDERLDELEAAGWSLPIYHDMILRDAKAVVF